MALGPRLEFRQAQSLTLTPQLMQSIKLLQLSHLELNAFVDMELLRNPLLEREDGEPADSDGPELPDRPAELSAYEDTVDHGDRIQTAASIADSYDTAEEYVFPEQVGQDAPALSGSWGEGGGGDGDSPDIDQFVAARPSLADHLTEQAMLILIDRVERIIAQHLIGCLDEAGYLTGELGAIADTLGIAVAPIESVLTKLQGCDPIGVFARNLAECLSIQLRDKDRLDPMMARLLMHLELLAAHDFAGLCRAVGCDRDDLIDMVAELKRLDPRPGRGFDAARIDAVVPDVFVRRAQSEWAVEVNSEVLPRVLVNRTYYTTVSRATRDPTEKAFLTDCLSTANWLTKSLDQRAQTILKVSSEIVRQQDGFLRHGIAHLRPMTLKIVADAIGMHESTVSRVTSNKYLSTPRGLYEMKFFFTTALASTSGAADHSAEAVRHRIRQLIEAEAPANILSDDTIAASLNAEQGIDVARRTVAKYREAMHIPSSVIRRRQKASMALAR